MKRPALRLVVNNPGMPKRHALVLVPSGATSSARFSVNLGQVVIAAKHVFTVLMLLVTLPFKIVRSAGTFCVRAGAFFFTSILNLFLGTVGLTLLFCLGYGFYRMFVRPWFM